MLARCRAAAFDHLQGGRDAKKTPLQSSRRPCRRARCRLHVLDRPSRQPAFGQHHRSLRRCARIAMQRPCTAGDPEPYVCARDRPQQQRLGRRRVSDRWFPGRLVADLHPEPGKRSFDREPVAGRLQFGLHELHDRKRHTSLHRRFRGDHFGHESRTTNDLPSVLLAVVLWPPVGALRRTSVHQGEPGSESFVLECTARPVSRIDRHDDLEPGEESFPLIRPRHFTNWARAELQFRSASESPMRWVRDPIASCCFGCRC